MTRTLLTAAVLLSTLLGGCTIHYHQTPTCAPCIQPSGTGDPKAPRVLVNNGTISVDQDVLRFSKDQVNVTIVWRLEGNKGGRLTFPENGVVFERAADGEIVDCKRSEDNTIFSCVNKHSRPGVYRYGINVNEGGKPLKPLDPYVMND